MIIDAHCHAGKGDGLTGPWDTDAHLGRYRARARAAGIDRTVIFAAFNSDYRRANRDVAAIVRADPARFIGFAFVHPVLDRGRMGPMVREAVEELGLRGIKAHRHDGRMTREVADAARAWRLPVIYDVQGDVASVELLAREFPDVAWIIPHLGSFADDWRAQVLFVDVLARHPNVFTDTAGVRRFDTLLEAVHRAGPEKIIFGSDGPWLHPGLELAKVRALKLEPRAEQLVLGGNITRLIDRARQGAKVVHRPSTRPLVARRDPWLPRDRVRARAGDGGPDP
ncbi:MAG TPA: amidohydrolase family protein [Acidimicrobiales bacterium]